MRHSEKIAFFVLRLALGWLYFYAGIIKVVNPDWSAVGYLSEAKSFPGFYQGLTTPTVLPIINFVNEWGLLLLGVSLILGLFVRLSSFLGIILMVLYYLPILDFPYPNPNSFIVDQHIVYILVLALFITAKSGRIWGLDQRIVKSNFFSRFPRVGKMLS